MASADTPVPEHGPNPDTAGQPDAAGDTGNDYESLVRQVAARVLELWRTELRYERERGQPGKER